MDATRIAARSGERTFLVAAGAFSAGVHAALAPDHLSEIPPLGVGFVVASILLAATVLALGFWPTSVWPVRALGVLFAGLIAGYAATRLFAFPGVLQRPEPFDPLGLCTCLIEAAGIAVALHLGRRRSQRRRLHLVISPGGVR